MSWLRSSDGRRLPLTSDVGLEVGGAEGCALRLQGADVAPRVASVRLAYGDVWLDVHAVEPPIAVNGRPVRALARVSAGDRICFGTFCVDVLGDAPAARAPTACCAAFALRVRGGTDSGVLQHGPLLHLDGEGRIVSAAAGRVSVALAEREVRLDPGGETVTVNGHSVEEPTLLHDCDQIRIGTRRYVVERTPAFDAAAVPEIPAPEIGDVDGEQAPEAAGDGGSLWWLIGIAALIAATVSALLYYHG